MSNVFNFWISDVYLLRSITSALWALLLHCDAQLLRHTRDHAKTWVAELRSRGVLLYLLLKALHDLLEPSNFGLQFLLLTSLCYRFVSAATHFLCQSCLFLLQPIDDFAEAEL